MNATDEREAIVTFLRREAERKRAEGHALYRPGSQRGAVDSLYRQADLLHGYAERIAAGDHHGA